MQSTGITKYFLFSILMLAIGINGCKRPSAPLENFISVKPLSFNPKHMIDWDGQAEVYLQVESVTPITGTPRSQRFVLATGPLLKLSSSTVTSFSKDATPLWQIPYLDIETRALTTGQIGSPLTLSVRSQNPHFSQFFIDDLAAEKIDFHTLPFKQGVLFEITDKPTATRSIKDATGAVLRLTLQRVLIGNSLIDRPRDGTYPSLVEDWWLTTAIDYADYKVYYLTTERIFEKAFGEKKAAQISLIDRRVSDAQRKRLKKLINQTVIAQLKARDRAALRAAIAHEPEEVTYSNVELFYKWALADSDAVIIKKVATDTLTAKAQKWVDRVASTRAGAWTKAALEKSVVKLQTEAEQLEADAVQELKSLLPDDSL